MLHEEDLDSILQPLMGKVFHATTVESLNDITKSGFIAPNQCNSFTSPFGKYTGYFKARGCVSFFDYRPHSQLESHINKCLPTNIFEHSTGIAILELTPYRYSDLVGWENWKREGLLDQQIVPYVEVGIEGNVELDDICSIHVIDRPADYVTLAEFERYMRE